MPQSLSSQDIAVLKKSFFLTFWRSEATLAPFVRVPYENKNSFPRQGRKTERDDYDIALLRIDYPAMDEGTGITVLPGNKFAKNTLMPICLPPNKGYVGAKN